MSALEGVRVLDLSQQYPGPFCTLLLADLGAEVWKVEPPGGEPMRHQLPGVFEGANRNKLGLTANLKSPAGREVVQRLAERADIFVEGFRPGVVARLGVDYPTLQARNPGLVYCSISGFGQNGPYRDLVGHDINYVAISGVAAFSGDPDGPPAWPVGVPVADVASAVFAAFALLAALHARDRTGRGQYVDLSMTDVLTAYGAIRFNEYLVRGRPSKAQQFGRASFGIFQTADDRSLALGVVEEKFWLGLCKALGLEDLAADPELRTFVGRNLQRARVRPRLEAAFRQRPLEEWLEILRAHEVPATRVNSADDALADPQLNAREMFFRDEADRLQVAFPAKLSETPWRVYRPAPGIGEHNDEVLANLGYSRADIDRLRTEGGI